MLDNVRHEKFAQGVANGLTVSEAYRQAGFSPRGAGQSGEKLLKKTEIRKRVEEIKAESSQECKLSKRQLLDFLVDVIATPAGHVQKDNPLCQSFKDTQDCSEIKLPDKLRAAETLAKLCGWNEPDKLAISGATEFKVVIGGSSTNGKDSNG
jgi:hypothetical protein